MLEFFTDPYPDEILVSAISRYHLYNGNNKPKETNRDLFGLDILEDKFCYNLNTILKNLVKNLGGSYSLNDIKSKNTLYPYYIVFNNTFKNLNHIHLCINRELYFCPICAKEDIEKYGETYFHREHQVGHITLCYKHRAKITKYKHGIVWNKIDDYHTFDLNGIDLKNVQIFDNSEYDNMQKVSKLSYDLLSINFKHVNSKILSDYYIYKLFQKGFFNTKKATINYYDIKNELIHFYGTNTLALLKENLDWVYHIDDKYLNKFSIISHLLLLNFLGLSINEFINEINILMEIKPVNYKKELLSIIEAKPNLSSTELKSTFIQKFPCIINSLVMLKASEYIEKLTNDEEKLTSCKTKITEYINSIPEVSKKDIRQQLQEEYDYVYSKDNTWIDINIPMNEHMLNDDRLLIYKNKIYEFLKVNQNCSRVKLRENLITEYNYVYKNDKKWIEKYVPTQKQIFFKEDLKMYKQRIEEYVKSNPRIGRTKIREALKYEYNHVCKNDKKWIEKYVPTQKQILFEENLKAYKQRIEEYVKSNPGIGRTKIREALKYEYNYVYKNDKKWIEKYVPTQNQILLEENLKLYKQKIEGHVKLNSGIGRIKIRQAMRVEYNFVYKKDRGWIEKHVPIKR